MEDKRSAVAEACKAKKALKYLHHFLSDILTFIEHIGKGTVSRSTKRNI